MTDIRNVAGKIEELVEKWSERLLAVSAECAQQRPAEDRWAISEVVGHLVDSACNNHQRFVRAQFVSALEFPKYEQNEWVSAAHYRNYDWASLARLWSEYNRMLATLIRHIPLSQLSVPCTITPYETCTLGFLISDYLDHLNHHLAILDARIEQKDTDE